MTSKAPMNVQSFPRPPLLERTSRHLQIRYKGELIADTTEAYWVLETHHPPTYYLPPSSVKVPLAKTGRKTWCEWKGMATYFSLRLDGQDVSNRIWTYEEPTSGFEPIRGFLSFYAGPWDCFVDGEQVVPQPGDFYGGWVTAELQGIVKGRTGNLDPVV
ncbi:hypothetical protein NLG97_g5940 [Lecanicillium saksenae]|uniref:Uncharacterized protein n=1 Tax=Lecanicillium saksenae TaxID=468837 RepID=A0ACC1QU78_9HYPO|nr:hypothetical protein NLG97_g5940 [Lecanicillium saksenae]